MMQLILRSGQIHTGLKLDSKPLQVATSLKFQNLQVESYHFVWVLFNFPVTLDHEKSGVSCSKFC